MRYCICAVVAFLIVPALAMAQGYHIRTWGSYDLYPYPPTLGGTYTYSSSAPTVTVLDSWGRPVTVPMQPKFLYYDSAIWTPQGWHRPTSITVIPDDRARYSTTPSRIIGTAPSTPPAPAVREYKSPAVPIPKVEAPLAERPIPTVPAPKPPREAKPALPAVPELPKLPDVPRAPGAAEPKLGPSPMLEKK